MKSLSYFLCLFLPLISAQRFLREGFSSQMGNEARGEMQLDYNESMSGMTREMFLMHDVKWELQPPKIEEEKLCSKVRAHINKYLNSPVQMQLLKKRGKFGLKAFGVMKDGKKLRAFWRPSMADRLKSTDLLEASYDEAVRSRLFVVEFEVQLPPMKGTRQLPSVVYQIPLENGSMNPKSMVPRSSGTVKVFPEGRKEGDKDSGLFVGNCNVSASMRNGIVDPGWAKGKIAFRKGRSKGFL
jgi:hypothetical protein